MQKYPNIFFYFRFFAHVDVIKSKLLAILMIILTGVVVTGAIDELSQQAFTVGNVLSNIQDEGNRTSQSLQMTCINSDSSIFSNQQFKNNFNNQSVQNTCKPDSNENTNNIFSNQQFKNNFNNQSVQSSFSNNTFHCC
jgi:hypothetical protein